MGTLEFMLLPSLPFLNNKIFVVDPISEALTPFFRFARARPPVPASQKIRLNVISGHLPFSCCCFPAVEYGPPWEHPTPSAAL